MGIPSDKLSGADFRDVDQLTIILGDQLDHASPVVQELNRRNDAVLMMEVRHEATHVPSHPQRTVQFFAAMRTFALSLMNKRFRVRYVQLTDPKNTQSFGGEVERAVRALNPKKVRIVRPGEHRVHSAINSWQQTLGVPFDVVEDTHFLTPLSDFAKWRSRRARPVMEYFYRAQRKRLNVLVSKAGKPAGGSWNFDKQNRETFRSPPRPPAPPRFRPDAVTEQVIRQVRKAFPGAYGSLESFRWPVKRSEARRALKSFVAERLPTFGRYQDAMWTDEPFLYHSLLAPMLNLKLLNPREVIAAVLSASDAAAAPINSVEGFIRQIIGWREFIRGVYWTEGPEYGTRNALEQTGSLPPFYWTGETDLNCLAESLKQVIQHGYGHHIQRLMVTGNFALISGVHPRAISDWYLGMYVDAVDWVTLPNTLGMAMYADGGVVGTKPYAASGRYINRMSNYCKSCRFDPTKRTGDDACPLSTFYWDFQIRNRDRFANNHRMGIVRKNLDRIDKNERRAIGKRADGLRRRFGIA